MTRIKSETRRIDNVKLKQVLGQIWADGGNLHGGWLLARVWRARQRRLHKLGLHRRPERCDARPAGFIAQQAGDALGHEALLPAPYSHLAGAAAAHDLSCPQPSAVSSTICARQTCFCGLFRSETTASSLARSLVPTPTMIPLSMPQTRTPAAEWES
jgi:hypothetical protein